MADEIRIPQEVIQFAYQEPGEIRIMQIAVQFAYAEPIQPNQFILMVGQ
jgi:hypothetical protein